MPKKTKDDLEIILLRTLRRVIRFVFIKKIRPLQWISGLPNKFRQFRQSMRESARQRNPRRDLKAILSGRFRLDLRSKGTPRVSVVIPLFNRAELTASCLRALAETEGVVIEVIVIDNASSDETNELLEHVNGLRVIRNTENLHFLKAVNQGAKEAQGDYLLIFNNDTEIAPDAIKNAVSLMDENPKYGAVGGRIVNMDGQLQEAGSIIWSDGSCTGYGRGEDPNDYRFQFRRYVDYCSGVFLLTPLERFRSLGGFDERFCP
ncbi:glycosyltransferase family 2 protein, partial [Patescibacteria group bacterium]|nr:glycosyltransferase family 2 protein [Patescibacteria group bacterium]